MLFWELPVPISSVCASLRFNILCPLTCPRTPLTTNTDELFCTRAGFSPMWYCRQILPSKCPNLALSISNGLGHSGTMLLVVSPPVTKLKITQPSFLVSVLQRLAKIGEILLALYPCKQSMALKFAQSCMYCIWGWAVPLLLLPWVLCSIQLSKPINTMFSPSFLFSGSLITIWISVLIEPSCSEVQTCPCLSCVQFGLVSMLWKVLWKSWIFAIIQSIILK